ncbi:MAG: OmpA family protein [Leptospiraceae bacterium]|nr:OmpA family protein [Leptospiraceae bacterium]MDW8307272.1 OmpA family protein [Leptospiraceae bacterium]
MHHRRRFFTLIWLLSVQVGTLRSHVRDLAEGNLSAITTGQGGVLGGEPASAAANLAALGAFLKRTNSALNFAWAQNLFGFQGFLSLPSSLGSLMITPLYISASESPPLKQYLALGLGYAKEVSENSGLGFFFKPAYGRGSGGSFFSLGIEPSFFYNTRSNLVLFSEFGFYDLSFYLGGRNIALNLGRSEIAPRMALHFGVQSYIWRKSRFALASYGETVGINRFDSFPLLGGFALSYHFFFFRGGFMHHPENKLYQGPVLGGGFDLPLAQGNIALHYSYLPPLNYRQEPFHFITLLGSWGYVDREPPLVKIIIDNPAFSPNGDGIKDTVVFEIEVNDASPLHAYRLEIRNSRGELVRAYESDLRLMEKKFSLARFLAEFFSKREYLVVPRKIRWDGTPERISFETLSSAKEKTTYLGEGDYFYSFQVEDIHGNISPPSQGKIRLDLTPPELAIFSEETSFSPNGDGIKEELLVSFNIKGQSEDSISFSIYNKQKKRILEKKAKLSNFEDSFRWDGRDDEAQPVEEGIYDLILLGEDEAGNRSEARLTEISLVRRRDFAELRLSQNGLSPNGDGLFDKVSIFPQFSSLSDLEEWALIIAKKKPEMQKPPENVVIEWRGLGARSLPAEVIWDGKNERQRVVEDGIYYVQLRGRYKSGNLAESQIYPLELDTKPPEIYVSTEHDLFSPDGDGIQEEQIFYLDIKDESPIEDYLLQVYEVQFNEKDERQRFLFRTFAGKKNFPEKIYWDGKGDQGRLVESATWYEYELSARDVWGNQGKSGVGRFETDILVLTTERGLKIRLSAIEFESGSAELKKKTLPVLERLVKILERYPRYKIKIEGHTDDVGPEEFNLKLSEERARRVLKYLVQKGLDTDRITYQGMGELYPLLPNTNWYNRSRNRRVEILLFKN